MNKRLIGVIVFTVIGLVVGIAKPFAPGLSPIGHLTLMGLLIAVGLWIFATTWVPRSIGGMLMMMLFLAIGLKYPTVFSGFTSSAVWILIPALYFGFALTKTGLGKRLAYWIISLFRPSYLTLTIAWVIIGLILSTLTPSITVRIAIVVPIAAATVELCRLQGGSKGASFIMLVAWAMAIIPGVGWLTGSLWGPIVMGFFEATLGLEGFITFESWSKVLLLPSELLAVLFIFGLYRVMKPDEPLSTTSDAFRAEYRALGTMSFSEKTTMIILVITFLMFVTGRLHHIPNVAICLGALFLLATIGIIELKDIGTGVSWDYVLFLGAILGLPTVFRDTGVSSFLGEAFTPLISRLAINPWLFTFVIALALFVWRFLDIVWIYPTILFLLPVFPIVATNFGIHPLVTLTPFVMAGNCFFISYQQPFVLLGEALGGKMTWAPDQLAKAGVVYFIACLITLAVTIPYWMSVGLIN